MLWCISKTEKYALKSSEYLEVFPRSLVGHGGRGMTLAHARYIFTNNYLSLKISSLGFEPP